MIIMSDENRLWQFDSKIKQQSYQKELEVQVAKSWERLKLKKMWINKESCYAKL